MQIKSNALSLSKNEIKNVKRHAERKNMFNRALFLCEEKKIKEK